MDIFWWIFPEADLLKTSEHLLFKDTHREKAPSNKTPTLSKSMNMDIRVVDVSNQNFILGS